MSAIFFILVQFLLLTVWPQGDYNYNTFEGKDIVVSGTIEKIRIRNEKLQILMKDVICSDDTYFQSEQLNSVKRIIVYLPYDTVGLRLGMGVKVKGTFYGFEQATSPGQMDMKEYYYRQGIGFQIVNAEVLARTKSYSRVRDRILCLRRKLENRVDEAFDKAEAGVIKAMLLGDKDALLPEIKDDFEKSGCSHLLVISGTHIAFLGMLLYKLLRFIFKKNLPAAAMAVFLLWGYCIMTDMGISTFRAFVMFSIYLGSKIFKRTYDLLTALSVAFMASCIVNPMNIYEPGFLLSFAAVLGIFAIRDFHSVIAITIFTFPLTLYFYYSYPIYSIAVNMLLIPILGLLLGGGMLCLIVLCIGIPAAFSNPLLLGVKLLLKMYMVVTHFVKELPYNQYVAGAPPIAVIVLYYILLGIILYFSEKISPLSLKRTLYALLLFLMLIRVRSPFTLIMADVGQGDGVVIYTRDYCAISDFGSSDRKELAKYCLLPLLKHEGIRVVDIIFISHTDIDHISGIRDFMEASQKEGIRIKGIAMSQNSLDSKSGRELADIAKKNNIKVYIMGAGDVIAHNNLRFECLYPKINEAGDANELSMVIKCSYKKLDILFCGDIEGAGEKELEQLSKAVLCCEVFKVAHHGSNGSSHDELLQKVTPAVSIISAGRKNRYGHPGKEALDRLKQSGSQIYVTKDCGAIIIKSDGVRIKVESFLKGADKYVEE